MKTEHTELLERLGEFNLDAPDSTFPFSSRLAKENQWSPAYARRVIGEYKRFTFLAVAAGHPVSPSEDVDQAWHLHLTYSHNYWRVFCPEVLRKPFHHQPTKGGEEEHSKFQDWYEETLASYEKFFGESPPVDIWPSVETRGKTRQHFVRVDREQHWIIPKPSWRLRPELAWSLGLTVLLICCSGAMFANGANPLDWRGPQFLMFYIILFAVCFGLAVVMRRQMRLPKHSQRFDESELSAYDIAYLNGGRILAVNTALSNLIRQNVLGLDVANKKVVAGPASPNHFNELERVICAAAARPGGETVKEIRLAAKTVVGEISTRLKAVGVVVDNAQAAKAVMLPLLIVLGAVAVGGIKIFIGIQRGKPVLFLVLLCLGSLALSLIALARRPLRSQLGDAVLGRLKVQHYNLKGSLGESALDPMMFAMGVGIFGMTALDGTAHDHLRKQLQPSTDFSSGCGSSCGSSCGGGCGSGCGGCGGD